MGHDPADGVTLLGADDRAWRRRGPSPRAVSEFGLDRDRLHRLSGGAGLAWSDGRVVVKPVGTVAEHEWVCGTYTGWTDHSVRVPEPVRPRTGESWSADGWGAHVFVAGRDARPDTDLDAIAAASDLFHAAVAPLPRPAFLDARADPWAYGDRLAWEDADPIGDPGTLAVVDRLRDARTPVTSAAQVVHGDVLPNVLLDDGRAPAVIDWPPYYRPAAFARAVLVTDAVTFRGAPLSLLESYAVGPDWPQVVLRALLYRLGPTGVFAVHNRLMGSLIHHVRLVRPVADAVLAMT